MMHSMIMVNLWRPRRNLIFFGFACADLYQTCIRLVCYTTSIECESNAIVWLISLDFRAWSNTRGPAYQRCIYYYMRYTRWINASGTCISNIISVGDGRSKLCLSQSNSLIGSVVDRVMSLKESHAKDVKWGCGINIAHIIQRDNQINFTGNASNDSVKVTRPYLTVRGEFECNLPKK